MRERGIEGENEGERGGRERERGGGTREGDRKENRNKPKSSEKHHLCQSELQQHVLAKQLVVGVGQEVTIENPGHLLGNAVGS